MRNEPLSRALQTGLVIRNGRVIDPQTGEDATRDLAIRDGRIVEDVPTNAATLDATGLIVCPGLIDIHVHLREPGQEHKEDIATGTRAAAAGGFTAVACMPNTDPALDTPDRIAGVLRRAGEVGSCRVLPIAAITQGRKGDALTDFAALREAGAVAFSDDGTGVERDDVMRSACELAAKLDVVLIQHCEFRAMSKGGVMHAGPAAERLGLPGIDPRAEEAMIERDIDLVRQTGARYHVAHISTAKAVELVRRAKAEGLPVTTEVCPHHLLLTDEACADANPDFKMHPPLRSTDDVEACIAGVLDGAIDCLVTDHAPHTQAEKAVGFRDAPFGIVGLETIVALCADLLVGTGKQTWPEFLARLTHIPRTILGQPTPRIEPGQAVYLTLIHPDSPWTIDRTRLYSRSKNTPFGGVRCKMQSVGTVSAVVGVFAKP